MENTPRIADWDFSKVSTCFHCRKNVAQNIKITPNDSIVTCANCGAERHYIIRSFSVADSKPDFEAAAVRRKYDVWKFTKQAKCFNCAKETGQEITMDEHIGAVVCPSCLFTRIYKFSVYSRPELK
ncbi:hypothetical protein [Methanocella sp. MCL-LM]|uniref:hypothetical protein n=1 Tax=Methanocella sp. MCL-LM TaxID=3412035 RepID=UPI003C721570